MSECEICLPVSAEAGYKALDALLTAPDGKRYKWHSANGYTVTEEEKLGANWLVLSKDGSPIIHFELDYYDVESPYLARYYDQIVSHKPVAFPADNQLCITVNDPDTLKPNDLINAGRVVFNATYVANGDDSCGTSMLAFLNL